MRDQFTDQGIVLERAIAFWVQRVQAQPTHTYRIFREAGLSMTPEQWAVLVRLWERGDMTQNELCDTTLKDKPTISRILDGMEEARLGRPSCQAPTTHIPRAAHPLGPRPRSAAACR